jgi:hypothetical protein
MNFDSFQTNRRLQNLQVQDSGFRDWSLPSPNDDLLLLFESI